MQDFGVLSHSKIKQKFGSLILDVPSALLKVGRQDGWVTINNRLGKIHTSKDPVGVKCDSVHTSRIHVADMFPGIGRIIQNRALSEWPVEFAEQVQFSSTPEISFVIPHRGRDREDLLMLTIRSIAALKGSVECIVVEQDSERNLGALPGNTRYVLAKHPEDNQLWHKSFAFNHGVSKGKGRVIVCQDSDIPVPKRYLETIQRHIFDEDRDVAYVQRFLFHLSKNVTSKVNQARSIAAIKRENPEMIRQNWTGGTLAIKRDAYMDIGGFDESFSGWSGEDREFYDRCQILNAWDYGYVPFLHFWHPPQHQSINTDMRRSSQNFTESKLGISREIRIRDLLEKPKGSPVAD